MPKGVYIRTKQWKEKQKISHLGQSHPHSEATKEKIRIANQRRDIRDKYGEILKLYQSGLTAQFIGKNLDCSKGLILRILREKGIKRRKPAPKKGRIPWNKNKSQIQTKGNKNPNWKDGRTPLIIKIRRCFEYKQWVKKVFSKDNYICKMCNHRGRDLQADHYPKMFCEIITDNKIKSFEEALDCKELWSLENGRTLCKKCHRTTFKKC